jgi:hypothetical protein
LVFLGWDRKEVGFAYSSDVKAEIYLLISRIKEQHGLEIFFEDGLFQKPAKLRCIMPSVSDLPDVYRYLKIFSEEIDKYPKSFFKKIHLKHVLLVKKLFNEESPAEGIYDSLHNVVYIEFLRGKRFNFSQRHNVHHEIFHVIDFELQRQQFLDSISWEALNPLGVEYSKEEARMIEKNRAYHFSAPEQIGFITLYARTSALEDRAEVFASLMVSSQYKIAMRWMRVDSVLKSKIEYIQKVMKNFIPDWNEDYWLKIHKVSFPQKAQ